MLLSTIIFLPTLFALILVLLSLMGVSHLKSTRYILIGSSLLNLALVAIAFFNLKASTLNDPFQMVEYASWIPSFGISYTVGLDSISMLMIALTALISLLCFIGLNLPYSPILGALYLFLQTGLYGTFLALDLFLFYFFWELALIPMLFIVGIWGGEERLKATLKFFIYTLVGSLFMLLAIIYMIVEYKNQTGGLSASYALLKNLNLSFDDSSFETLIQSPKVFLFLAFTFAFVIKIPMVPFHTWQPLAYKEAPLPAAIFMSAVLAKMGTYGLLRYSIGLFPDVALSLSYYMMGFAILSIIYGAYCAWAQTEIKKFIAYSSISHSGYIILGLFTLNSLGMTGALYQMFNHALFALGMFLIAFYLYERFSTYNLEEMKGVARAAPLLSISFFILILSSVALPGTNSFVGEFSILLGTFKVSPLASLLAGTGIILGAIYALKAYQDTMFGMGLKSNARGELVEDLKRHQLFIMFLIGALIVLIGFFPEFFFEKTKVLF